MKSGEQGLNLAIEKQRMIVSRYCNQESALKTRQELMLLGRELAVSQAANIVESVVDTGPWDPIDENMDEKAFSPVMDHKKSTKHKLSKVLANPVKTFSMYITNPLHTHASRLKDWIISRYIFAVSEVTLVNDLDKKVAVTSKELDSIEEDLMDIWTQIHEAEEQLDLLIQQMHCLPEGPKYASLEQFRGHIAAGLANERRAGRPSALFSSAQPLLRGAAAGWEEWSMVRLAPAAHDGKVSVPLATDSLLSALSFLLSALCSLLVLCSRGCRLRGGGPRCAAASALRAGHARACKSNSPRRLRGTIGCRSAGGTGSECDSD
jgi:uncharacterized coiled-coil protein SlyX